MHCQALLESGMTRNEQPWRAVSISLVKFRKSTALREDENIGCSPLGP